MRFVVIPDGRCAGHAPAVGIVAPLNDLVKTHRCMHQTASRTFFYSTRIPEHHEEMVQADLRLESGFKLLFRRIRGKISSMNVDELTQKYLTDSLVYLSSAFCPNSSCTFRSINNSITKQMWLERWPLGNKVNCSSGEPRKS